MEKRRQEDMNKSKENTQDGGKMEEQQPCKQVQRQIEVERKEEETKTTQNKKQSSI